MAKEKFDPSFSAAAGEHYVAARLSAMRFVVAVPRGGSPAIDILVSTPEGSRALGVQVKTGQNARYVYKRKKKTVWIWPMGLKEAENAVWHVFVNLRGWPDSTEPPECFILSPEQITEYGRHAVKSGWKMATLYLGENEWPKADDHRERWDLLAAAIRGGEPGK